MVTRSKTLYAAELTTAVTNLIAYTVPANVTTLVKEICVSNENALASLSYSIYYVVSGGGACLAQRNAALAARGIDNSERWSVLLPGDEIEITTSVSPVGIWISGAELEGLAP